MLDPQASEVSECARIRAIDEREAGPLGRYLLASLRRAMGKLPYGWRIAARVVNVHRAWAAAEFFFDRSRLVEAKLKRLAALKASLLIGCPS